MAEIRYLFALSFMTLAFVRQLICHPHSKKLCLEQNNPDLHTQGKDVNDNHIQWVKINGETAKQFRDRLSVKVDSSSPHGSVGINDKALIQVKQTPSRRLIFLSTTSKYKDTTQISATISGDYQSVPTIPEGETSGKAMEKVRMFPTPNPANEQGNQISSRISCPQTCQCEFNKAHSTFTIKGCKRDPSQELYTGFGYAFTELNIVNAKLGTFPCYALENQFTMTTLRLWRNNIKSVSCYLRDVPKLRFLDMSWNMLEAVPSDILVTKLDTLLLSHNKIMEVSASVYQIATLDLSYNLINYMPSIPHDVKKYTQNLNLSHNLFKSMPCNLNLVFALEILDLGYNDIREAPCDFHWVLKLVLTHNRLTEVPKAQGPPESMNALDISYNAIVSVSCNLLSWPDLYALDMSHNVITEVTCNLSTSQLTELNIAHNVLDMLPCNLSIMPYLTKLDLSHNNMKSRGCKLSGMPLLARLDLSNNYLTVIPFDLSMMSSLSYLDLSWNLLMAVPDTLLILSSLQDLNISNNALKAIPNAHTIGSSLHSIDLSHNSIEHVNADFLLSVCKVHEIYLNHNKLNRLPDDIGRVRIGPDTYLYLSENPWICDCESLTTRNWIVANNKSILDVLKVACYAPSAAKGKPLLTTNWNIFCPNQRMYTIIYILVGVVGLLVTCFPLICMIRIKNTVEVRERKAWKPVNWDEAEDEGKEFDVFVSYCNEDEEYIGEYLIPELEARGFKVCFHRVHFLGGKSIIDNICECIAKSKKMLVFYSKNFTKSNFGMYEFNMAMDLDAQNATTHLITIMDKNVDIQSLQITHSTYFRTHSYIIREEPRFWDNLIYTLPRHHLGNVEAPGDEDDNDDSDED